MTIDGDLDYALARIAARRARRPGPDAWRNLESLRAFAPALAAAREAGLADWIDGLGPRPDPHRVEAALREGWLREIATLARWMPERWRPALNACAFWIHLPALRAERADTTPAGHASARTGTSADAEWLAALLARLRAAGAGGDAGLARLGRLLAQHRVRFAALPAGNGWPQRAELESTLLAFLHSGLPGPATAFAWVVLQALELERLRGLLVPRAAREVAA